MGGMMNPMAAMGGMNAMTMNMSPLMSYMSPQLLELLGGGMQMYDDDDTGVWDGDDEDENGIILPRKGNRRRGRRARAGKFHMASSLPHGVGLLLMEWKASAAASASTLA